MQIRFKNAKLQEIADECGLYIAEQNSEVTSHEIEFFATELIRRVVDTIDYTAWKASNDINIDDAETIKNAIITKYQVTLKK